MQQRPHFDPALFRSDPSIWVPRPPVMDTPRLCAHLLHEPTHRERYTRRCAVLAVEGAAFCVAHLAVGAPLEHAYRSTPSPDSNVLPWSLADRARFRR